MPSVLMQYSGFSDSESVEGCYWTQPYRPSY